MELGDRRAEGGWGETVGIYSVKFDCESESLLVLKLPCTRQFFLKKQFYACIIKFLTNKKEGYRYTPMGETCL